MSERQKHTDRTIKQRRGGERRKEEGGGWSIYVFVYMEREREKERERVKREKERREERDTHRKGDLLSGVQRQRWMK